jgi:DNA polymerase I
MRRQAVDNPLILVDGSSYLYRAFHAFPPLTNASGEPTGAILGVLNMLGSLLRQYQPTHVAVIFDAQGKNHRHALYADYKAHRPPMPAELSRQIEPLYQIIDAMGIPRLAVPAFEADDVMGTLACRAAAEDRCVIISSGDKDMTQLVTPAITVVNTMTNTVQDVAQIKARYGIAPPLIVDLFALMGDSIDNIPGVPGIGEKTALALLQAIGSLQAIYADLSQVEALKIRGAKRVAERLALHRELAELSYRLATIDTAVALSATPTDLQPRAADFDQLCTLLSRYELKRWLAAAQAGQLWWNKPTTTVTTPLKVSASFKASEEAPLLKTILIADEAALAAWLVKLRTASLFSLYCDTEALDRRPVTLIGVAMAVTGSEVAYLPCGDILEISPPWSCEQLLAQLKPLLEEASLPKVGHYLKPQQQVLVRYGITLRGVICDTRLASYLLDSSTGRDDLPNLATHHLQRTLHPGTLSAGKARYQGTEPTRTLSQVVSGATEKAAVALQLYHHLWPQLQQQPRVLQLLTDLELSVMVILARMEAFGVLLDVSLLQHYSQTLAVTLQSLEEQAHTLAGEPFNLSSPKQLQQILFEKQQIPCFRKTPGGAPSTDESVLSELALRYPLPAIVLRHRSLAKLKSTYTDTLPLLVHADGRIHTTYHQTGTSTGRLSSSDPNLQNIPIRTSEGRHIRQAFIAPEGYQLLSADYSQIELRIMAHLSGDQTLLEAFADDQDVHSATAAELFDVPLAAVSLEQRRQAKTVNFGLIYGMSAFGLARQLGINRQEAQAILTRYFERYPGVLRYMQQARQQALEQGYVETLMGRRLYLPDIHSANAPRRQAAERAAVNAPVQGSGADIIKHAMVMIDQWCHTQPPGQVQLVLQVHDELIFEIAQPVVPEATEIIRRLMVQSAELSVPLKVDIGEGPHWAAAH